MNEAKIFTWDHREQPDWDEIGAAVADLSGGRVHVAVHDTQSDEYEIVVYRTDAP